VFVAIAKPESGGTAFLMTQRLRKEGLRVVMEQAGRGMKGQLRQADRVGARATVIVGDSLDVKDMDSGEQRPASGPDEVVALVREAFGRAAEATGVEAADAAAEDARA
jgi:histidyl-tRNA synthetase